MHGVLKAFLLPALYSTPMRSAAIHGSIICRGREYSAISPDNLHGMPGVSPSIRTADAVLGATYAPLSYQPASRDKLSISALQHPYLIRMSSETSP